MDVSKVNKLADNLSVKETEVLLLLCAVMKKNSASKEFLDKIIEKKLVDFLHVAIDSFKLTLNSDQQKVLQLLIDVLSDGNKDNRISEEDQATLFELLGYEKTPPVIDKQNASKHYFPPQELNAGYFRIQNRRYLGNKHKLLGFIEDVIAEKCGTIHSICDIFAGTGVVGARFNNAKIKIIANDFLAANYICLKAFLGISNNINKQVSEKIYYLNNLNQNEENYFSENFGGTYFTNENAMKIGVIRAEIENIATSPNEKSILVCSLLYAVDKIANTVGHYDAYRKKMDMLKPLNLLIPEIEHLNNKNNAVYQEDANTLIKKIYCDVLYIDPPYNSRQYSDAYHLLENLAEWKKPKVIGVAKKMNRAHIKSSYCLTSAATAFSDLIRNADCNHILLSYNNTGKLKDCRSNARLTDDEILQTLEKKGSVDIFEKKYKAFTTGKSDGENNTERIFYCKVLR